MTWAGYWLPNLVQWVVGGAIGALASVVVGFLVRRWFRQLFGVAQDASNHARDASEQAAQAAKSAGASHTTSQQAAKHSLVAAVEAAASKKQSEEANEAILWLANQLGEQYAARNREADQHDRVWAAYLDLLRRHEPARWALEQQAADVARQESQVAE